jgi:uncharacterized membrane protein YidH (DUF202 family)
LISVVAFAVAGLLWVWVLVSAIRRPDERRAIRIATYVGLALVVPAVAVTYIIVVR